MLTIKTTLPKSPDSEKGKEGYRATDRQVSVNWDCPDTLKGMVEKFGEQICVAHLRSALTINVQAVARKGMADGKSDKEIQDAVNKYKPGLKVRGKSPQEKLADQFAKMPADQKAALLAQLTGIAGGGKEKKAAHA